jgi:uncharacterized protein
VSAPDPSAAVARATQLPQPGVRAVLRLLDDGATVPFIARYRKESTGSLDEVQIRAVEKARASLAELEARRATIRAAIEEQGKLTPELAAAIAGAKTKTALEDLYLPYKKRRKTRADQARERGLEPLARRLLEQPAEGDPTDEARAFVGPEVPDAEAALAGASDIAAEAVAERAEVRARLRWLYASKGELTAKLARGVDREESKFSDWDGFSQLARSVPSHRYLALDRGEREKALRVKIEVDAREAQAILREGAGFRRESPFGRLLDAALEDAFSRLLAPSLERELRAELEARAHEAAVKVFAENLKELLLAAPFGAKAVLGVDPGLRTGSKCALVASSGELLAHETVFLTRSGAEKDKAKVALRKLVTEGAPEAIAVGNGTGGRETEAFLRELARDEGWRIPIVSVSEAGASVYSASDIAREELPDVDLTVRGAVSIARRLQDPLAELVKIDPRSIGVGQYQHDVKPALLARALDAVVEDAVNAVGVDLGTASGPLLARVAGIGPKLAGSIVRHREAAGGFRSRRELLDVKGLGKKAFEQAAGFLRVKGENPLDASAVHPERYSLVEKMAKDLGVKVRELVGRPDLAERLDLERYVAGEVGLPTLQDIRAELSKPGRDPRAAFEAPRFRDDVHALEDLREGMELEGVVTNVTSFGAFVDIGVHQDGLVHVSELSDRWVSSPADVVKVGQRLKVRVLSVDARRRRIGLSAKSQATREA